MTRTRRAMRARLAARDHAWQTAATRRRAWARRNALVLIGVLLLGAIAGACAPPVSGTLVAKDHVPLRIIGKVILPECWEWTIEAPDGTRHDRCVKASAWDVPNLGDHVNVGES